ncbi:MAG: SPOR domain-containing protein [Sphingomonadaceae bacterium]
MRSKNKFALILCPFAVAISGCGYAAQDQDLSPAALPDARPALADGVQGDQSQYDQVGYAGVAGAGEDAFIVASHGTLPVPSYAEVTNLDSGRTILVRISDNQATRGRLIALSPAAAKQLGVEGQDRIPVRVRRTNPPEFERAALRNGMSAGERMATPASLLSALRKRLGAAPSATLTAERPAAPAPAMVKLEMVKPAAPKPAMTKPAMTKPAMTKPAMAKPGVTFGRSTELTSPPGDRFIVEETGGTKPSMAPKPAPVRASAVGAERLFIQIASFGVEARAVALAHKVGGSVQSAGSVWRVRMGPYENEAAARAALGQVQAKGYRDARVTR